MSRRAKRAKLRATRRCSNLPFLAFFKHRFSANPPSATTTLDAWTRTLGGWDPTRRGPSRGGRRSAAHTAARGHSWREYSNRYQRPPAKHLRRIARSPPGPTRAAGALPALPRAPPRPPEYSAPPALCLRARTATAGLDGESPHELADVTDPGCVPTQRERERDSKPT
jgi:hypothetical protein